MERLPVKRETGVRRDDDLSRCWTKTWNRAKRQRSARGVREIHSATDWKSLSRAAFQTLLCCFFSIKTILTLCVSNTNAQEHTLYRCLTFSRISDKRTTAALTLGEVNWPLVVRIFEVSSRVSMSSDPMFSKLMVRLCVSPLKSWMDTVLDSSSLDIGGGVWADLHRFMKIRRWVTI